MNDDDFGWPYYADMTDRPPHFLRQWRQRKTPTRPKGMTQQDLADALGTSKSTISDLETFRLQLSPKWLNRIAPVLDTQPGYILDHDPDEASADVFDIWSRIPERDREQAARVLRQFTRTGTDD